MALRADDVDLERDRTLVLRFQAGDDAAFDELYRRYHDRLERFCLKRVGDEHAAEEVTQEAFTRALSALPDLGGELRFYPWVSVIAARLCVDWHRRQLRSEPAADPDPGLVAGGEEAIVDAVDASLVVAALARLAPRHQDVLHLREVEGWSYQHIADHYGVKVGTVETLLFRARRALRREFHLADGVGLAALPLIGRMVLLAGRARNRLPAWLPSAPSPTTLAAAVTATAAAVALAAVPSRVPIKAHVAAPAHLTPAPSRTTGASGARSKPATVVPQTPPAASPLPTAVVSAATGPATSPSAPPVTSDPDVTTTTTAPVPAVVPPGPAPDTISGIQAASPVAGLSPGAVPSVGGVAAALPSLPSPTLPLPALPALPELPASVLSPGSTTSPALGTAQGPLDVVGGLLRGGR